MDKSGSSASSYITLGLVCIILAGLVGFYSYSENKMAHWPTASGKIISTRVEKVYGEEDDDPGNEYSRTTKYRLDKLFVDYQFKVNKEKYVGEELHHQEKTYKTNSPVTIHRHMKGKTLLVHYNPENPKQSTVKLHGQNTQYTVFASAFLAVVGLFFFMKVGAANSYRRP